MTHRLLLFCFIAPLLLSGCAAAILGSGVSGGIIANDERSAGAFIEDEIIEDRILIFAADQFSANAHVAITSYNRRVLLTGQVPDRTARQTVVDFAEAVNNVREVIDRMEVAKPSSLGARTKDTVLTARIKAALCSLQEEGFSCLDIKVVTEKQTVYLLGLVNRQQAATAVQIARLIRGVDKVIKVFEYPPDPS